MEKKRKFSDYLEINPNEVPLCRRFWAANDGNLFFGKFQAFSFDRWFVFKFQLDCSIVAQCVFCIIAHSVCLITAQFVFCIIAHSICLIIAQFVCCIIAHFENSSKLSNLSRLIVVTIKLREHFCKLPRKRRQNLISFN